MFFEALRAFGTGMLASVVGALAIGVAMLIGWASAAASGGGTVTVAIGLFAIGGLMVAAGPVFGLIGAFRVFTSADGANLTAGQREQFGMLAFSHAALTVISADGPPDDAALQRVVDKFNRYFRTSLPVDFLREQLRLDINEERIAALVRLRNSIDRPTKMAIAEAVVELASEGGATAMQLDAVTDVLRALRMKMPSVPAD